MAPGRLAGWETAGVPFLADDLGAWLVAVLADAGRRRLIGLVHGSDQERALRQAAAVAVQLTAGELFPEDEGQAEQVALVISEVFQAPVRGARLAGSGSVLEGLRAGIAGELAVLDDADVTGTGRSSADVLGVAGVVLAERLTAHLLREIVIRGAGGGPLTALASQLNADVTHLQVRRLEGVVDRRADELLDAMARLDGTRAAAPVALAQLPPAPAGFTGRDGDLAVLAGLLDPAGTAGSVVVSAVAGLAGVGKTALAVQAGHAARRQGWFGGGVLFIDLHGYDGAPVEPQQALDALLRALGVPAERVPPTVEERAGMYRSVLADSTSSVLVIADNASSEAQVRPLLPGAGPHKVLVTSRNTLAALGARLVDVTVLDQDAAAGLLDAALRAARPHDDRIAADPGAAALLAGICGGLPLALQITAAILTGDPALSAAELAQELATESGRLERLVYDDGSGTAAPSVAAAFELSYRRLEEVPARVFRLLPASPGTDISTGAAAALADLPAGQARGVLAGLAKAHLVEAAPGAAGRWRMHDLVRLYARQLSDGCADADGREEARDRLLSFYLGRADAADDHLRALPGMAVPEEFAGRNAALEWLDSERASLVAAVTMAADTGRDEAALRLPLLLAEYFDWRRRFDDWIATTIISLNAARRLGDRRREGDALTILGLALREVRRFEEAITAHQDAATIFLETGDRHSEGTALNNLGLALREVRRFEEAITAHQEDLAICRETGDRHGEGIALGNLGLALQDARRFEEAITACQDAATIYRETGDRHGEGITLNNLGLALHQVRRFEEAITACQDAAAIFRKTGDRHGEGAALNNLGNTLQELGRSEEAITAYHEDLAICRETGDRHGEGMTLENLGLVLQEVQQFGEAITAYQDALAIYRETGDQYRKSIPEERLEKVRAAQPSGSKRQWDGA
jgi:tetratricopeptide (TPR) repeat protein